MQTRTQLLTKSHTKVAQLFATINKNSPEEDSQNNPDAKLQSLFSANNQFVPNIWGEGIDFMQPKTTQSDVILIVDDNPSNLQVLFSYLEQAGFKVLLAEDGKSAIQIAQSQTPDLILLDILMPELNGFETCQLLKSQTATKDIPIIFLTALSETLDKVQGFELGGVDYITKPTEQEEVLMRIQTHLTIQRMRHKLISQNQELQQTLNFEALVRRITDKIRDSLDEITILQTATTELAKALDLNGCQIELYDPQQVSATIAYEYTITLPKSLGTTRKVDNFPELYVQLLEKIPVQLVEKIPQFNPTGIQVTRLACPIFDDQGIIGNLWGLRPPEEVFNEFEIRLMQQVASQCAIAIRQARLYETSQKYGEELKKLNQLKDDFLKTISHELKTPMSSIQLATQTMEKLISSEANFANSPTFSKVFQIFHQSCQRQSQLIEDLLTLTHVDAKSQTLVNEWIDLHPWITNITELFFNGMRNPKHQINFEFERQNMRFISDPLILERIFRELLNNALKYTPDEEQIIIKTQATDNEISLCVINTGIEISPEEQELVFTPFYRIPSDDPWQYAGTGLGLTLVQKLAKVLGASVNLESKEGQTVFSVIFAKELFDIS
ncbi:MAG: response regulator [Xenococcaceae cyanobacterium MO_188.B19]|nr:response regulator [Xenococcaceae cyanobacterium MO_188.B19]